MKTFPLPLLFAIALPDLLVAAENGKAVANTDQGEMFFLYSVTLLVALGCISYMSLKISKMRANITRLTATLDERTRILTESDLEKETYKALYDLALVGIFRSTIDGDKFITMNSTCANIFGYTSPLEMISTAVPRLMHSDPDARGSLLEMVKQDGKILNLPSIFRRRDGSLFYAIFSATINQEAGYIDGTFQDVTQLKLAEIQLAESRDFLQSVIDAMPIPISVKNRESKFTLINEEMASQISRQKHEVKGKSLNDFAPPEVAQQHEDLEQTLFHAQGKASLRFESQGTLNNISTTYLVYKETLLDASNSVIGIVSASIDISRRKRMEEALRKAEERYRNIYMNALEGIFTATVDGVFVDANPAMAHIYGFETPEQMLSTTKNIAAELWVQPKLRETMLAELEQDNALSGYDIQIRRPDGETIWVTLSIRAIRDDDGVLCAVEGIAIDSTERKLSTLELSLRASTDPLTGLANRAQLEHSFEHMIAQAKRSGEKIGVLFIDLDGFKPINDTYGHEAGDTLLREVSGRIRKRVRDADLAARMGGDEFVIILWDIKDSEGLYRIGRELLEELNSQYFWNDIPLRMGASIGGCIYPDHGNSAADLLRCADKAMYTIKQSGKNALRITQIPDNVCKVKL